jgi:hypothetical protein
MFVYYQKLGKFNPDSGEWVEQGANKELIVSEGTHKFKLMHDFYSNYRRVQAQGQGSLLPQNYSAWQGH